MAGVSPEAGGQKKWCGEHLQTVEVMQMHAHNTARGCIWAPCVGLVVCSLARLRYQVELEQAVASGAAVRALNSDSLSADCAVLAPSASAPVWRRCQLPELLAVSHRDPSHAPAAVAAAAALPEGSLQLLWWLLSCSAAAAGLLPGTGAEPRFAAAALAVAGRLAAAPETPAAPVQ